MGKIIDSQDFALKAILIVVFMGAIVVFLGGFTIGAWVQQKFDHELAFIEENNLTGRACLDNRGEIGYCRRLSDSECGELVRTVSPDPEKYAAWIENLSPGSLPHEIAEIPNTTAPTESRKVHPLDFT